MCYCLFLAECGLSVTMCSLLSVGYVFLAECGLCVTACSLLSVGYVLLCVLC